MFDDNRTMIELSFKEFKSLRGSIYGSDSRAIHHYIKYIAPYLSNEGIKKSNDNIFSSIVNNTITENMKNRILSLKAGKDVNKFHETFDDRKIRISHVNIDSSGMHAITHSGEKISFSRIIKPEKFETPKDDKAIDVERTIATNIKGTSAGYNKHAKADVSAETNRGILKLESKTTKGKFGQISRKYDSNTKSWSFHGHPLLVSVAEQSKVNNENILDYMNRNYSDGKLTKGFSVSAPKGSTKAYIVANGMNVLHIHDNETNIGTTYTIGGEATDHIFYDTGLDHLSDDDLHSLDHKIEIAPNGSVIFRAKITQLKKLAKKSLTGKSLNMHNKKQASSWLKKL